MVTPVIVLLILTTPLGIALAYSQLSKRPIATKQFAYWGLGLAFIFFFIGHFVKTDGMVEMLPAWVPYKTALIYATGVIELFIGIALFNRKLQATAAKLAIVVLVVFFPANIYAAMNSVGLGGHQWGPVYLLVRAPLQMLLIAWAYFMCIGSYAKAHSILGSKAVRSY